MALEDKFLIDKADIQTLADDTRRALGTEEQVGWSDIINKMSLATQIITTTYTGAAGSIDVPVNFSDLKFINHKGAGSSNAYSRVSVWTKDMGILGEDDTYIYLPTITTGPYGTSTSQSWSYTGTSFWTIDGLAYRQSYSSSYNMIWWIFRYNKSTKALSMMYCSSAQDKPIDPSSFTVMTSNFVIAASLTLWGV